jgi:hypothetical protein
LCRSENDRKGKHERQEKKKQGKTRQTTGHFSNAQAAGEGWFKYGNGQAP